MPEKMTAARLLEIECAGYSPFIGELAAEVRRCWKEIKNLQGVLRNQNDIIGRQACEIAKLKKTIKGDNA